MVSQCLTGKNTLPFAIRPMLIAFASILQDYYPNSNRELPPLRKFKQEVLFSYRIIFGQDRRSRDLFHAIESKKLSMPHVNNYDPLLTTLCGKGAGKALNALPWTLWPSSCVDSEGHLLHQNVYSTSLDFPMLGPRLMKLQTFSVRQQPSHIQDLWRDRRNVLQWYTFWAVLIFGGLTILISTLQLIVSAAQLAVAIRPPTRSRM